MITISKTHLSEIHTQAKDAYPEECCGAMLGKVSTDGKVVSEIIMLENEWDGSDGFTKHRRFQITPKDYMLLEKKARAEKLDLIGFYHTHPDHPAIPSETDLSYAWPVFSYVILSVQSGTPQDIHSYILNEESKKFDEESILINS